MKVRAGITCIAIALMVASYGHVRAQIAGGMDETTRTDIGGRNFIVGTIYSPSGFPIESRMRIRLASLDGGREVLSMTDDHGKFIFSGLPPGSFMVYIDDDTKSDYEAAAQSVEILNPRNTPPQSYQISFRLAYKARSMKAGVLRAELAGVPKKALNHYQKALTLSASSDVRGAVKELQEAISIY